MAKRYFEYKDAKSKKFWEVSVSGKKVNIRYGKLGTDGQTSLKELSTPAEAKAHAEKQAAGKVKKGYKEAKAKAVKKASKKKAVKKKVIKKKVVKKKIAKKATKKATKKVPHPSGIEMTNKGVQVVGSFIPAALDPIEKKIYEKLESLITDNKSIDALGSFDEDPDNYCIQSWLVEFVFNEGLHKDIFDSKNYKKEDIKELETILERTYCEIGGGFRPTVLLDYDDNPDFYGVAESAEGDFNDLEFKATLYAGIIAGKLGFDISPIIDYWGENGWDNDINALKTLIDS